MSCSRQVLQSAFLTTACNAPWFFSNRKIYEDLGIPFFADQIRALSESFDSTLVDTGKPLSSATLKAFVPTEGWLKCPTRNRRELKLSGSAAAAHKKTAKSTLRVFRNYSASLTKVYRVFTQLYGICHGIIQKGYDSPTPFLRRPSAKVILTLLVSAYRHSSKQSSLSEGQTEWWDTLPQVAAVPSLIMSRPSAKTTISLQ
jgi:hypothetical protein